MDTQLPITKFQLSFYWIGNILFTYACLTAVSGSCTFPSDLIGQWIRGRDSVTLTFTSTQVTGLQIPYFATTLDTFTCDSHNGAIYIVAVSYTSLTSEARTYYACWNLEKVTASAFIFYELTSDLSEVGFTPAEPGVTESAGISVSQSAVCTQSVSTTFFTTFIKNGATPSELTTECPSSLFATFTYGLCSQTELDFCVDRQTAKANYTLCAIPIFNSAEGLLSCMGHVDQSSYTYVNLVNNDGSNGVTCLRVPSVSSDSVAPSAIYYSGDCTTASGSGTTLTLTATVTCPKEEATSSSASISIGVIAGSVVAVLFLVALVAGGAYLIIGQKTVKSKIVHDDNVPSKMESGNGAAIRSPESSSAPVVTMSNFPFPIPHDPTNRKLPPIETMGSIDIPPGEPLRT